MTERAGPKPWKGCDTSGLAWKAYCEAWEHCYRSKSPQILAGLDDYRGKGAAAVVEHNMRVVRADYAGEIEDRARLPTLLRL